MSVQLVHQNAVQLSLTSNEARSSFVRQEHKSLTNPLIPNDSINTFVDFLPQELPCGRQKLIRHNVLIDT